MIVPVEVVEQFFNNEGYARESEESAPFICFCRDTYSPLGQEKVFFGTINGDLIESDFVVQDISNWDSNLAERFKAWIDSLVDEDE